MKKLRELIQCDYDTEISGIKSDSRHVMDGDLFVAVHGFNVDHHEHIDHAISNGAVAIISEREIENKTIPCVVVSSTNQALLEICKKFYNHADEKLSLIGVTGTDGKTSTTVIIEQLMNHFIPTAYMGTNGIVFRNTKKSLNNTTPETEYLYREFSSLEKCGCKALSMEVSSEALMHGRVDNLNYDFAILTNITNDHLNIHGTLQKYVESKGKLFSLLKKTGSAILNIDDEYYEEILPFCKGTVYTYGIDEKSDFKICRIVRKEECTEFDIVYSNKTYHIESPLKGTYNVYNLTAAFIVLFISGIEVSTIQEKILLLEPIPGRREELNFGQNYKLILDYAHTENGVNQILIDLFERKKTRIITVIGSAGGREKEKRSAMGKAALDYSDHVIFTMDDPRTESVDSIIDDLVSGSDKINYERIINREEAIYKALSMAKENDIVAILGKGRDTYMALGTEKLDYCDYNVIESYFNKE